MNSAIDSKACSKCGVVKGFGEFRVEPKGKDGYTARCKVCHRLACKESKLKHADKVKAAAKTYRENNHEKMYELQKSWKIANKEKRKNQSESLWLEYEQSWPEISFVCSQCSIEKSFREFYRNRAMAHGLDYHCKECSKSKFKNWRINNIEQEKERRLNYYENNFEKIMITRKIYIENNLDKINVMRAKRRAAELRANVSWANQDKIKEFYAESIRRTKMTGIQHHVDHIVPLVNDHVCGLHNEFNLQVLTASENSSKRNKFTPG